MATWTSTAGLATKVEPVPTTLPTPSPTQQQIDSGEINLHIQNHSRIPLRVEYLKISSSDTSVATVAKHTRPRIAVPGRKSKYSAQPVKATANVIATWVPASNSGGAIITAELRVSSAVVLMGYLTPHCSVTTT
jgi:hypothetical protein